MEKTLTVKFCIDTSTLTRAQKTKLAQFSGGSRAVYNWCVREWRDFKDRENSYVVGRIVETIGTDDKEAISTFRKENKKAVSDFYKEYKEVEKEPNAMHLRAKMKAVGFEDPEHPLYWNRPLARTEGSTKKTRGVPTAITDKAFRSFDASVQSYYRHIKTKGFSLRKNGTPDGSPQFKSRWDDNAFGFANLPSWSKVKKNNHVTGMHRIEVPHVGSLRAHNSTIRLARLISAGGVPKSAHFTQKAHRWYVSFTVSVPEEKFPPRENHSKKVFAGDVGINKLLTSATGEMIQNRRLYRENTKKLAQLQRKMSAKDHSKVEVVLENGMIAKVYKDPSYEKVKNQVARLHHKMHLQRSTYIHEISKKLSTQNSKIILEKLNIAGMLKRPKPKQNEDGSFAPNGRAAKSGLAKSISDASWGELFRQLEYKSKLYGPEFVQVDPRNTSKTCHECGHVNKNQLLKWEFYVCEACGHEDDRDVNAAKNILSLGLTI